MATLLQQYERVVGTEVIDQLWQLARLLDGMHIVHINSTRAGGGVAEILHRIIPLKHELGIDTTWETITGDADFFQCTKLMHNTLQGNRIDIPDLLLRHYENINTENATRLKGLLEDADIVFIHDPQPAAMIESIPSRKGKWIWRCHIDVSSPYRPVWKYLRDFVRGYDASVWSLSEFAQRLPHPMYLIPPSIDPLSDKNSDMSEEELANAYARWEIDPDRPVITQISRFDRFKDPLGVVRAYRLVKDFIPVQLVLAGGGATDDPEGEEVFNEVKASAGDDPDVHILLLPPDDHRTINALQRISDIVLQKSTREGFGLTVTEALWKGKPVIGGDTGGIRLQVVNHHTGFLVNTPEGAALRIRYLLKRRDRLEEMGQKAREFVRENFLITRHLREYLTLVVAITNENRDRIELL
ncbi:MAG: Trehalose synthase [Deltaproteobacteria bacterium ADurb.BinA179]|jgi:trehalose synthase|nr:glycosyltransferase [Deltaproteobacteria bacterium]MDI9542108.1 glycosyltransferase [Pseudomonadota bacterium]OPZ28709.1 MAG: Trehalose synthase [Deltaproteobacteria bacterium ADurb.BinA179]HRR21360.1 glycosyltransferase [Desulfomonilia bacterium]HNR50703.1 glycosyltransferase [Deltaproteobacteria bacterium]